MCRRLLYFRGMYKKTWKWEEEKIQNHYESIFNTMFDDIIEDVFDDYDVIDDLAEMQVNFNKIVNNTDEYLYDEDDMYMLLNDPYTELVFSRERTQYEYEFPTFLKYLFVPNTFGHNIQQHF